MSSSATTRGTTSGVTRTKSRRIRAVAAAVVAAVIGFVLIEGVGGVDLRAPAFGGAAAGQDIDAGAVIFTSLVASIGAWGLLALFERYTSRPRRTWVIAAIAGLVLSLGGPMSGTGIDGAKRGLLVVLHLAVGAVLIPLLYRTARVSGSER